MGNLQTRESIIVGLLAVGYALAIGYIGGPSNLELIVTGLLLVGACCYKFLPAFSGRPVQWGLPFTVLVAYVAWLLVLMYTSTLPENSLHFAWLLATFPMVTILAADMGARSWYKALLFFGITGMVSAIWGISVFIETGKRAHGPIVDPSSWCAIMNLFFFASVYALLTARDRRIRGLGLVGVVVFSIAAFSAYSRVGTLVIVASFAFICITSFRFRHLRSRLLVIMLVLAASYGGVHSRAGSVAASNDKEGYTLDFEKQGWSQRFSLWRSGWNIYLDHPAFGSGPGTFKVQYPKYRTHGDLYNLGNFVHNDYLEFLLEGGPVMLMFLLSFVVLLLIRLSRSASRLMGGDIRELEPVILTVGMGTLLVESLMSFPMYQMQTQMMVGLLFARYLYVSKLLSPATINVTSPRLAKAAVLAGVFIVCAIPVLDTISSMIILDGKRRAWVAELSKHQRLYVDTVSLLATVRSQYALNRFEMATIYRTSFDEQKDPNTRRALAIAAALEYQAGLARNPYHQKARDYFANFLEQNSWLTHLPEIHTNPTELYRQGIELTPVYLDPYMDFARYLRRHGKADQAYELLVKGALPWVDLHYGDYYTPRYQLFTTLLPEAKRRGDRATLERIYKFMNPGHPAS